MTKCTDLDATYYEIMTKCMRMCAQYCELWLGVQVRVRNTMYKGYVYRYECAILCIRAMCIGLSAQFCELGVCV